MAEYPMPDWLRAPNMAAIGNQRAQMQMQGAMQAQRMAQQQAQFGQQMAFNQMQLEQRKRIAEQELAQRLQIEQAQLQQKMQIEQMQLAAKEVSEHQRLQQQANLAQHRLAVQEAYNTARVGLGQQRISTLQGKLKFDQEQETAKMAKRQAFERAVQENIRNGMSDADAFQSAVYRQGVGAEIPSGAFGLARPGRQITPPDLEERTVGGTKVIVDKKGSKWVLSPNQGTGQMSTSMVAPGVARITDDRGRSQTFRIAPFKFSKQRELDTLASGIYKNFLDPDADISNFNKAVQADIKGARVRYTKLLDLLEKEQAEYQKLLPSGQPIQPPGTSGIPNAPAIDIESELMQDEEDDEEMEDESAYDFDYDPAEFSLRPR